MSATLPLLYQGSVKDLRGPVQVGDRAAVIFDYTDAYSVFDWGRMPDALSGKGASLAIIASHWFEKLALPETWREFSKSPHALTLRRGNRFGAAFNELGETLQNEGLRTHYLGVYEAARAVPSAELTAPFSKIAVTPVSVVKPALSQVAGRTIADYASTRGAALPRLIPLEVVFRFSCPGGSSLLERVARDPQYLASLGYGDLQATSGAQWEFPVLELFTKLESTDRPLTLSEGLAISGISGAQLQELLFKTAWISGWLKGECARAGLALADGKLEWALGEHGELILVDAIGPDELRILSKDGMQLSKEFIREFYRKTPWYEGINRAKREASSRGSAEWKKWVAEGPQPLSPAMKELATQLYWALANELTGRRWFPGAWDLVRVAREISEGAPHAAARAR